MMKNLNMYVGIIGYEVFGFLFVQDDFKCKKLKLYDS